MKPMVMLVVAGVVALFPGTAWAADELGLSKDGVTFSPTLTQPLFDPNFIWVPGCTETASFWVRNQSPDHATLDVAIIGGDVVDSLIQTGDLAITVAAADGSGSTTTTTGRHILIASRPVAPGRTERINVTVAFDPASNNVSQEAAYNFRFEVRLTHEDASEGGGKDDSDSDDSDDNSNDSDNGDDSDNSGAGDDRTGSLPGTGGPVWWLLPAGLLGVGVGRMAVVVTRRKEAPVG